MMSTTLPDGWRGRLLALAITAILVAISWLGFVSPMLDFYSERAARLEQRTTLANRMAAVAETVPSLKQQLAARTSGTAATSPPESALLDGAGDAIAGATLQTRLGELAIGAGITLASVETLPATDAGAYRRVLLRLSFAAPWPSLVRLLASVDHASPKMVMDDIQFRGLAAYGQSGGRSPNAPVQATMTVAGFRANGEARPVGQ